MTPHLKRIVLGSGTPSNAPPTTTATTTTSTTTASTGVNDATTSSTTTTTLKAPASSSSERSATAVENNNAIALQMSDGGCGPHAREMVEGEEATAAAGQIDAVGYRDVGTTPKIPTPICSHSQDAASFASAFSVDPDDTNNIGYFKSFVYDPTRSVENSLDIHDQCRARVLCVLTHAIWFHDKWQHHVYLYRDACISECFLCLVFLLNDISLALLIILCFHI